MRRVPQKMWGTGYHRIFGIRYIYRICSPTVYYCWVCKITHTKMIALAIVLMHVRQLRTCPISLLTHSYTTHARTHGCSNAGEIDCTRVFAVHSQTCPNMYIPRLYYTQNGISLIFSAVTAKKGNTPVPEM